MPVAIKKLPKDMEVSPAAYDIKRHKRQKPGDQNTHPPMPLKKHIDLLKTRPARKLFRNVPPQEPCDVKAHRRPRHGA